MDAMAVNRVDKFDHYEGVLIEGSGSRGSCSGGAEKRSFKINGHSEVSQQISIPAWPKASPQARCIMSRSAARTSRAQCRMSRLMLHARFSCSAARAASNV